MFPIRVKTVQESDLRMLGDLARNIQRVLPVTQADIDAAAALGKGWVVWKVVEVNDPIDNLRGGTQLVIKQNSITPGQNVRRVLIVSGPGGETVVIGPGPSPLLLPDAIANSLSYVKAFGGTYQGNIPQQYTQVNYVTNTAQTAVDTGIMIDFAKNYEFEVECRAVGSSWYILQSRASSSGNITGIHGATSGNTITLVVGNVTVCTSAITRTVGNKLYVKATLNAGTATLYVKDETANTEDTQTGSYGTSQPNPTAAVYLLGNAGGQYVDVNSDIYMARIKENDTVVMDYVPARQVATAGFYDKASGTFKTAETPANLSADGNTVPTPDAPVDIVSNNGVLKYGQYGKNLFNKALFNTDVGATITYTTFEIPNGTYTMSTNFPYAGGATNVFIFAGEVTSGAATTTNGVYDGQSRTITVTNGKYTVAYRSRTSTSSNTNNPKDYDFQLELGSTATPYEPYREGIYTDGTVETIKLLYNHWDMTKASFTAPGFNIPSASVAQDGTFSITNSSGSSAARIQLTLSASVLGLINGQKYTLKVFVLDGNAFNRSCYIYHGSSYHLYSCDGTQTTLVDSWTQSADDDIKVGFFYFKDYDAGTIVRLRIMVVAGETEPDTYQPYIENTATAEMLLKVGDYQDEQEILSGAVTRNVGVKVFDGTENFETATATNCYSLTNTLGTGNFSNRTIVCSHFASTPTLPSTSARQGLAFIVNKGSEYTIAFGARTQFSTLTLWTQWLADQYAAGTPVIVIYPLATPTTESVTGQTLQVTDGDNTLEITQASLPGLELEAEYTKVA